MQLAYKKGNFKVSQDEWIAIARKTLIEDGVGGIVVGDLAAKLGVSRGGFYWFFKSRTDLLDQLLHDWEVTNTRPFFDAVENAGPDGLAQLKALFNVWYEEKAFSPAYDSAIRDWARTSVKVRRAVTKVDDARLELLTGIYKKMGYDDDEALIRARVAYYHQIGYYSLGISMSADKRKQYLPLYTRILAGR